MRQFAIITCLLLFGLNSTKAQQQLYSFNNASGEVEFPFEYTNNFIIITVIFNNTFPLKFIFDTGAENTIITKREITDLLSVDYRRPITILGSDLKTELQAHIATGISLELGGELFAAEQSLLVLEEDYFRFEQYAGINVQGILGADFLRRFVVHIDYRRKRIKLEDPRRFKPPRRRYTKLPAEFFRHKPYLTLPVGLTRQQSPNMKLLMDTGASLTLLVHTNTDTTFQLPDHVIRTNLGMGLGGFLEGYVGRVATVDIGDHQLTNVITNFQDLTEIYEGDVTFLNKRNGIIGNEALERFNFIIDYIREEIYLRPNRNFRQKFHYDRSGLSVIASGTAFNSYTVMNVVAGSPADEAGIIRGDQIRVVNGIPTGLLSLQGILRTFQKRVGKRVKLVIKRGDDRFPVEFQLRDII